MKNSIMTLLAVVTLLSCNKKETTTSETPMDTTAGNEMMDSSSMIRDSATVSTSEKATLNDGDKMFVDAAAKGGMMEVMMGDLAAANGTNTAVKSLGSMISQDHKKANEELKTWAASVNYTLPSSLDASQQKMLDDLKAKKGAEFDKAYAMMMVEDHKKDIASFTKQSTEGNDSNVKAFAAKILPILQKHLKESEKVWAAVK